MLSIARLPVFLLFALTAFKAHAFRIDHPSDHDAPASRLLPAPVKVALTNEHIVLNSSWSVSPGLNISKDDAAVVSLLEEIKERFDLTIPVRSSYPKATASSTRAIQLIIKDGAVQIGKTTGTNRAEIMKQAYRVKLSANTITITANAKAGLFYGVQTLVQLLSRDNDNITLPQGEIEDWPDMELRIIYWDDAHHLERLPAMKRAIRQAAAYKINGFGLKLEGHFQFKSAKSIIEPYAYTAAEYQELTNYAKQHYVELMPFLDGPAHVAFILKHPEFASLRAYPDNNYEFSVVNPKTYDLLLAMFNELFDANKGCKYVFFSTDEAYYVGKPDNEKEAAKALGGNGKLLAQFITKIANELQKKGRNVIIWGEYPLRKNDITALPSHLINGVYDDHVASAYKDHGIRQLIYTSTQGVEPLFPSYHSYPGYKFASTDTTGSKLLTDDEMQQGELKRGRVDGLLKGISNAAEGGKSNFLGTIVAGWGDSGLNPETFWLGYATGSASGWNREGMNAKELTDRFYRSFYGSNAESMTKIYQLLCSQAQFWEDSWESAPLQLRTPILGNSEGIFDQPRHLKDQTLLALPVPSGNRLSLDKNWTALNAQRLQTTEKFSKDNAELIDLLHATLRNASTKQYNLRVFLSIAELCKQNLDMLLGLQQITANLKLSAEVSATPAASIALIDQALDKAAALREQRNATLQSLTSVWYEEWFPRVAEANGRVFLDKVDDIKDHVPVRTIDMSYLIYRQIHYPMDKWASDVQDIRNKLARENNLPLRSDKLEWKDTGKAN